MVVKTLGEFFLDLKRNYTVKFVEEGEAVLISRRIIEQFIRSSDRDLESAILANIIKSLSAKLSESNRKIAALLGEKNEAVEILRDDLMSLSDGGLILKKDFDFFYSALNALKVNFENEFYEEKRKALRYQIANEFNLKIISDLLFEISDLVDISVNGCKIEISNFSGAEVGQLITGQILNDFTYFCDFNGEIRWVEGNMIGIEFLDIEKSSQKKLEEIVNIINESISNE